MAKQDITVCIDAYPDPDTDVFRIGAADDILRLLVDAHDTEFSIPELVDATGVTRSTVWRAVDPSTVSTPSRFEKRLNATTSRSTQTVSRRTTRSWHLSIRIPRADPSIRRPRPSHDRRRRRHQRPPWDRHLWKRRSGRQTDRAISIASWSSMATGRQPAGR